MKIAMIGQKGIPTLFGGIERHVEGLSYALVKENHQVFVYARTYYTPKKTKQYQGIEIIHLPSIRTKHLDAISHVFLASWHAVFKIKPEVIHYHGIGPAFCLWIPKLFSPRTKIIFTFHCRDYFHQKWGKFAQISLKLGEMIGCSLADEIIAVSFDLKKYIKKTYHREAEYIPHGVEINKYLTPNLIKKWGLEKNGYLLVVSRLIAHKGIHYLIKAYQQIKTDKKLVIVGPSFYTQAYENKLKKLARNENRIIFLGAQSGNSLKELFSNAYVFIHPSKQEGLPLTVLEAGSFNCPLLLSEIPAHKKIFQDLPFFFKNKNIRDLKEKLEFILKNPKLASQRAKQIKNLARQNYNWDKVVERIILKYA